MSSPLYVVTDWDEHYENNRTRGMVKMQWVPLPNHHDGDGYTELLDHKNGSAHYGFWCALLGVASRCAQRGTLLRDNGHPHDPASLSRLTRHPVKIIKEVLPRLAQIGWIECKSLSAETLQEGDGEPAPSPHHADDGMEGRKGRKEGNGREGKSAFADAEWLTEKWNAVCASAGLQSVRLPLSASRRATITAAMRATDVGEDEWVGALTACSRDKHWRGQNDRGWKGNIKSFLRPEHRDRFLDASHEIVAEARSRVEIEKRAAKHEAAFRCSVCDNYAPSGETLGEDGLCSYCRKKEAE